MIVVFVFTSLTADTEPNLTQKNLVSKLQIPIVNCKAAYRQPLHHLLTLHHPNFKPLNDGHDMYKG